MQRKVKAATALSVLGALLGCAQVIPSSGPAHPQATRGTPDRMPVKVAAAPAAPRGASGAEVLFSVGRYAHGAGQLDVAAQRYAQALEMDPAHVGALNAMAVIHAQADRTDEALRLFKRATQLAPKAVHIHNNTGYALLRAGRLDEARAALKQALDLDPSSLQTAQNLDLLAKEDRRRATASATSAQEKAGVAEVSGLQLVAVARNVYELRMPAPQSAPQSVAPVAVAVAVAQAPATPAAQPVVVSPAVVAVAAVVAPMVAEAMPTRQAGLTAATHGAAAHSLRGVRLEVSNGVGIANLARRTADWLAPTGVITARLTNARPFRQAKTEIQFVSGQDLSAQALQARLPVTAAAVAADKLDRGVQIRLVLGRDAAGRAIAAWLDTQEVRLAAAPQPRGGGWAWF